MGLYPRSNGATTFALRDKESENFSRKLSPVRWSPILLKYNRFNLFKMWCDDQFQYIMSPLICYKPNKIVHEWKCFVSLPTPPHHLSYTSLLFYHSILQTIGWWMGNTVLTIGLGLFLSRCKSCRTIIDIYYIFLSIVVYFDAHNTPTYLLRHSRLTSWPWKLRRFHKFYNSTLLTFGRLLRTLLKDLQYSQVKFRWPEVGNSVKKPFPNIMTHTILKVCSLLFEILIWPTWRKILYEFTCDSLVPYIRFGFFPVNLYTVVATRKVAYWIFKRKSDVRVSCCKLLQRKQIISQRTPTCLARPVKRPTR